MSEPRTPFDLAIGDVVIDCNRLEPVAAFWAAALGYERTWEDAQWAVLGPPKGATGMTLILQLVPEAKSGKNRAHVDLRSDDMTAEVARLEALGGSTVRYVEERPDFYWTVMADPDGNEFCVAPRRAAEGG
ncbi:MAG: VOC family protein [Candidatus Limnocylindrales bacterium]